MDKKAQAKANMLAAFEDLLKQWAAYRNVANEDLTTYAEMTVDDIVFDFGRYLRTRWPDESLHTMVITALGNREMSVDSIGRQLKAQHQLRLKRDQVQQVMEELHNAGKVCQLRASKLWMRTGEGGGPATYRERIQRELDEWEASPDGMDYAGLAKALGKPIKVIGIIVAEMLSAGLLTPNGDGSQRVQNTKGPIQSKDASYAEICRKVLDLLATRADRLTAAQIVAALSPIQLHGSGDAAYALHTMVRNGLLYMSKHSKPGAYGLTAEGRSLQRCGAV
jgi:hypothetical protein